MSKTRAQRKEKAEAVSAKQNSWWLSWQPGRCIVALAVAALAVLAAAHLRGGAVGSEGGQELPDPREDGLGPKVMASQGPLLKKLIGLLKEVEELPSEERWDERMAVSQRVEAELNELEAIVDGRSAGGKQHLALIALARSALQDDRKGPDASLDDWSEEKLYEAHGLVTYASKSYWDEAYGNGQYGEAFDWFGGWEEPDVSEHTIAAVFRTLLTKHDRILMLGCGISNMSALMYNEGYQNIVNVDVSEPAVKQMQKRWGHLEGMEWKVMDASDLNFSSSTFDVVVEKGLFDALFAGTGVRSAPVLEEAMRVLYSGGRLLSISFGEDRIQRLFMPRAVAAATAATQGADSPGKPDPLNCTVAGELRYASRKRENRSVGREAAQNESQGKPIFVYSCIKT